MKADWKYKMNWIIKNVLGEGYSIKILSDEKFETYFGSVVIIETETVLSISSHWKKHVRDTILLIITRDIERHLRIANNLELEIKFSVD